MPVALAEKGLKRICPSCGNRYYDFNQRPVKCPSCATEFTGELKVKSRRGRVAAIEEEPVSPAARKGAAPEADEDDIVAVEGDEDTVSLDEVVDLEEGAADADDDTLDLDTDLDDDLDDAEVLDVEEDEKD